MKKQILLLTLLVALLLAGIQLKAQTWPPSGMPGDGQSETTAWQIRDTADLAALARLVNDGESCAATYFKLTADLDLSGWDMGDAAGWKPIGYWNSDSDKKPFRGKFDGNGKTISGLHINRPNECSTGLFSYLENGAEVRNLTLWGESIACGRDHSSGSIYAGGVAGKATCNAGIDPIVISNCHNHIPISGGKGSYSSSGGIIGNSEGSGTLSITFCSNSGTVTADGSIISYTGGISGSNYGTIHLVSCNNSGTIAGGNGTISYNGGIVGRGAGQGSGTFRITSCINSGAVAADRASNSYIGGIIGRGAAYGPGTLNITSCSNKGSVIGGQAISYTGGIIGYGEGVGSAGDGTLSITSCSNTGSITVPGTIAHTGGIIGYGTGNNLFSYIGTVNISNCYAVCSLTARDSIGGITGFSDVAAANSRIRIDSCYFAGNITTGKTNPIALGNILGYFTINNPSKLTLTKNYYDSDLNQNNYKGIGNKAIEEQTGAAGKPTLEMQQQATFSWSIANTTDHSNVWNIWEGKSYPYFQYQSAPVWNVVAGGGTNIAFELRNAADSVVVYKDGTKVAASGALASGPGNITYLYTSSDILNLVVYEPGKSFSYPVRGDKKHTITAKSSSNGTITPAGNIMLPDGGNQRFTFAANNGYQIEFLLVDGVNIPDSIAGGSYTFENITANHTIRVVTDGSIFCFGEGSEQDPFQICDTATLATLARLVNDGEPFAGTYFKLTADLDISGWNTGDAAGWKAIGYWNSDSDKKPFRGKFDGNGKSISGLRINRPDEHSAGLFGYLENGAQIRNLTLYGDSIACGRNLSTGYVYAAGIAGYAYGSIGSGSYSITISGCHNHIPIYGGKGERSFTGGIIGYGYCNATETGIGTMNIALCSNSGAITGGTAADSHTGGITGFANSSGYGNATGIISIVSCINSGTVTGGKGTRSHTGGIAGISYGIGSANPFGSTTDIGTGTINITSCSNSGTVMGRGDYSYTGGISGTGEGYGSYDSGGYGFSFCIGKMHITSCSNSGAVTGNGATAYTGGIIGTGKGAGYGYENGSGIASITSCSNSGIITGNGTDDVRTGGIIGDGYGSFTGTLALASCSNTGTVTGGKVAYSYTGGITGYGYGQGTVRISNSYAVCNITDRDNIGGIMGYSNAGSDNSHISIDSCYFAGGITATASTPTTTGNILGRFTIYHPNNLTLTKNYYDNDLNLNNYKGIGNKGPSEQNGTTGKPTAEMKQQATFAWDFTNIWKMCPDAYPVFLWENCSSPATYTIAASADANGSISPGGNVSVLHGDNQQFTFTPNTGYQIDSILVDGVNVPDSIAGGSYTFVNVAAAHSIRVVFERIPYIIVATSDANGSISPNGNVSVLHGDNQAFTFTPNTGYRILQVLMDGTNNPAAVTAGSYTFSNVTENHTLAVSYERIPYTIEASAGANGSISPNGNVTVLHGDNQAFTFTPNTGYRILQVLVDGTNNPAAVTAGSYTFSNVTANHTIAVSYERIPYTIAASAGTGGTISPNGNVTVLHGDNQMFAFTPNTGYRILQVLVDGVNNPAAVTAGSYTFSNVTANHTIAVSYEKIPYIIAASSGANGSISPNGNVTVLHGDNQAFTFSPNTGYRILQVLVDGVNNPAAVTAGSYTFSNVTANHTIAVSYERILYTIAASAGTGGTISPNGNITVLHGDNQSFTFTPDAHYKVFRVFVDGQWVAGEVPSYTLTNITANHTIHVDFTIIKHAIVASVSGGNGTISPEGNVMVNEGGTAIFNITPNANYKVKEVLVDGVGVGAVSTYLFSNVTGDHTIAASFERRQYSITASCNTGGSITPTGNTVVNAGDDKIYVIAPNAGYKIKDVLVDGVGVGAVTAYTFANVQTNHSIEAQFEKIVGLGEAATAALKVYPNPTTGELKIENGKWKVDKVEIFTLTGQRVFKTTETEFSIAHLPAGMYILKVDGKTVNVVKTNN